MLQRFRRRQASSIYYDARDFCRPVNMDHPLNRRLVGWWMMPREYGGAPFIPEMVRAWHAYPQGGLPLLKRHNPRWPHVGVRWDWNDYYTSLPFTVNLPVTFEAYATQQSQSNGDNMIVACPHGYGIGMLNYGSSMIIRYLLNHSFSDVVPKPGYNTHHIIIVFTGTEAIGFIDGRYHQSTSYVPPGGVSQVRIFGTNRGTVFDGEVYSVRFYSGEVYSANALFEQARRGYEDLFHKPKVWSFGVDVLSSTQNTSEICRLNRDVPFMGSSFRQPPNIRR